MNRNTNGKVPEADARGKMHQDPKEPSTKTKRLVSLDAYRGLIMISLISGGFGLAAFAGHPFLGFLATQTNHVKWEGLVYWDLIEPAKVFFNDGCISVPTLQIAAHFLEPLPQGLVERFQSVIGLVNQPGDIPSQGSAAMGKGDFELLSPARPVPPESASE